MKPRNREVNIFNMSVLDLLTGALGAFCFLTLALFPYYFKASGASASENADIAKAARQLKDLNSKLTSDLATAKANEKGMPAFALGFGVTQNPQNQGCGGFQVSSVTGPGGDEVVKLLPVNIVNGYASGLNLFLLAPGTYHLSMQAYAQSTPCTFYLNVFGARGTTQQTADLTTSLAPYTVNFEVKAEDLSLAETMNQ